LEGEDEVEKEEAEACVSKRGSTAVAEVAVCPVDEYLLIDEGDTEARLFSFNEIAFLL
jgi:hypothetical protein